MTINIAVVTSDALVLGCDSIASTTSYLVDPFACSREENGDGPLKIVVAPGDYQSVVTNTWDGVTKMFPLQAGNCPVAAVTAGLAKLNSRSMSSYANEFFIARGGFTPLGAVGGGMLGEVFPTVLQTAQEFLAFMRGHYEAHYANSPLPDVFRDGPLFLVGGYDAASHLPCLYRINVQANTVDQDYAPGDFGVSWEGQSDAVERVVRGYDTLVKRQIEAAVKDSLAAAQQNYATTVARIVEELANRLGSEVPSDLDLTIPPPEPVKLPWDKHYSQFSYGNLPLQDTVDFAAYLVGLQSGKAKFAYGVATVGGRTHIGVITKAKGFAMLSEPELRHTNVGFL